MGFAGFPNILRGVSRVCADFRGFCMVFCRVSGFRRFWAGFSICGRSLKPQASKSWRIVITVIVQCCAKSDIFVGTISGARKRGKFATVLREASTVAISEFCNLKNVLWKKRLIRSLEASEPLAFFALLALRHFLEYPSSFWGFPLLKHIALCNTITQVWLISVIIDSTWTCCLLLSFELEGQTRQFLVARS